MPAMLNPLRGSVVVFGFMLSLTVGVVTSGGRASLQSAQQAPPSLSGAVQDEQAFQEAFERDMRQELARLLAMERASDVVVSEISDEQVHVLVDNDFPATHFTFIVWQHLFSEKMKRTMHNLRQAIASIRSECGPSLHLLWEARLTAIEDASNWAPIGAARDQAEAIDYIHLLSQHVAALQSVMGAHELLEQRLCEYRDARDSEIEAIEKRRQRDIERLRSVVRLLTALRDVRESMTPGNQQQACEGRDWVVFFMRFVPDGWNRLLIRNLLVKETIKESLARAMCAAGGREDEGLRLALEIEMRIHYDELLERVNGDYHTEYARVLFISNRMVDLELVGRAFDDPARDVNADIQRYEMEFANRRQHIEDTRIQERANENALDAAKRRAAASLAAAEAHAESNSRAAVVQAAATILSAELALQAAGIGSAALIESARIGAESATAVARVQADATRYASETQADATRDAALIQGAAMIASAVARIGAPAGAP